MSKARTAAFRALLAIGSEQMDLPAALVRSRASLSDERDRSLTMEIVTGSLRWQRSLDHLVEQMAHRPLTKLDADVLVILRLSLYQLLHLDRVPAAAVVDDAVDLTRMAGKSSAAGFVNGVLRSTLRNRHRLPLPPRPDDPGDRAAAMAYLSITHSHPDWLVARWLERFGFDATEQWVRFNNDTAPLTLRTNRNRLSREQLRESLAQEDVDVETARYAPAGLIVTEGNPLRRPLDGTFVVQDEASQLVAMAVDAQPGENVLDLCAAPGGKTGAMSDAMGDRGVIVACDVRERRMRLLQQTIRLSGARHSHPVQIPVTGPLPFTDQFDRVLVDAPCSGLGTVRRDPDIKWRRQEADLAPLAERQLALLHRAAATVRRGGRLVYATCSSEPEENEQVMEAFLATRSDFTTLDLRQTLPSPVAGLVDDQGALRTSPVHGLEAFFAAAVMRTK